MNQRPKSNDPLRALYEEGVADDAGPSAQAREAVLAYARKHTPGAQAMPRAAANDGRWLRHAMAGLAVLGVVSALMFQHWGDWDGREASLGADAPMSVSTSPAVPTPAPAPAEASVSAAPATMPGANSGGGTPHRDNALKAAPSSATKPATRREAEHGAAASARSPLEEEEKKANHRSELATPAAEAVYPRPAPAAADVVAPMPMPSMRARAMVEATIMASFLSMAMSRIKERSIFSVWIGSILIWLRPE